MIALAIAAVLAGLAPANDARQAIALGPHGEIYAPSRSGGWVRTLPVTLAGTIDTIARGASAGVVVGAGHAVYRLAANGWTAVRLAQKGKAVGAAGTRGIAALGRDVFDLDKLPAGGEPPKLGRAPDTVLALAGTGTNVVVRTARGVVRLAGNKPIANVPANAELAGDRWATTAKGAFDLRSGKLVAWPAGWTFHAAMQAPDGKLVASGGVRDGAALVVVDAKAVQSPITLDPLPTPAGSAAPAAAPQAVGIVADKAGRVAIAFRDGRIALRDRGNWSTSVVSDALPTPKPGSPPATSP